MSMKREVAALVARYGFKSPDGGRSLRTVRLGEPPDTEHVQSMGPLVRMEVRRLSDNVREVWRFRPYPRLAYSKDSKRLWSVGGAYHIDGAGFHNTSKPNRLKRVPVAEARKRPELQRQLREYKRTHYGLSPIEAVTGEIVIPKAVVALATLEAIVYATDRNDGDGISDWKHLFVDEGLHLRVKLHSPPTVCCNTTGTWIYFVGGTYSVKNGWLVG